MKVTGVRRMFHPETSVPSAGARKWAVEALSGAVMPAMYDQGWSVSALQRTAEA